MKQHEIDAIYLGLRDVHPEFSSPLTWNSAQRVLRRTGIRFERVPLDVPALLMNYKGIAVILLNADLDARSHTEAIAHEYAHIHLHSDEPGELPYHVWTPDSEDPRELEADYLAKRMMLGPAVDVLWPFRPPTPVRIPAPAPAIVRRKPTPMPSWMQFDPYNEGPIYRPSVRRAEKAMPAASPARKFDSVFAAMFRGARVSVRPSNDEGRLQYLGQHRHRFVDADGRAWTTYDFNLYMIHGRSRRRLVEAGSESAEMRCFVNAAGVQRRYYFGRGELHDMSVRHLERQLREARTFEPRRTAQEKTG